ncbi:hypothetical protein ACVGVM_26480 [Pseudonocardia bannensis]|uniref:Uncharacterized protein n=1 Tax=Pseudonocardia bannensis TaxID=630973 RepID=A0A848DDW1_9PSEU|nr:hypothetical protein [Pseudonocardia bannensis]NMH90776.1 hypothetical protein [Pseudonocardia bannensis]
MELPDETAGPDERPDRDTDRDTDRGTARDDAAASDETDGGDGVAGGGTAGEKGFIADLLDQATVTGHGDLPGPPPEPQPPNPGTADDSAEAEAEARERRDD